MPSWIHHCNSWGANSIPFTMFTHIYKKHTQICILLNTCKPRGGSQHWLRYGCAARIWKWTHFYTQIPDFRQNLTRLFRNFRKTWPSKISWNLAHLMIILRIFEKWPHLYINFAIEKGGHIYIRRLNLRPQSAARPCVVIFGGGGAEKGFFFCLYRDAWVLTVYYV